MKKLLFTRFGIGVFDENWLEYRLKLFETITLPSIENLESAEELYWIFLIDADMPLVIKRKLLKIVRDSRISGKIYIRPVDFYDEIFGLSRSIRYEFCEEDEFAIISRLDADDALGKSIFTELESFAELHKNEQALVSFPDVYAFLIEERRFREINFPLSGLSTFWITNNREYSPFDSRHGEQDVLAVKRNIKVYTIRGYASIYTKFRGSDSYFMTFGGNHELFTKKWNKEDFVGENEYLGILSNEFGISTDKLENYYNVYPITPNYEISIDGGAEYKQYCDLIKGLLRHNKSKYIQYRKENKNRYKSIESQNVLRFEATQEYYSFLCKWFEMKQNGKNVNDWLVSNNYKKVAIYGIGTLGRVLYNELKDSEVRVEYYVERYRDETFENSLKGYKLVDLPKAEAVDLIIVTPIADYMRIAQCISMIGEFKIMSLNELIETVDEM